MGGVEETPRGQRQGGESLERMDVLRLPLLGSCVGSLQKKKTGVDYGS